MSGTRVKKKALKTVGAAKGLLNTYIASAATAPAHKASAKHFLANLEQSEQVVQTADIKIDPDLTKIVGEKLDLGLKHIEELHGTIRLRPVSPGAVGAVVGDVGQQIIALTGHGNPSGWGVDAPVAWPGGGRGKPRRGKL